MVVYIITAYGGGGIRQGHHLNALLLNIIVLAGHASEQIFQRLNTVQVANEMPSIIKKMNKVISKTCWLNFNSIASTSAVPGYTLKQIYVRKNSLNNDTVHIKCCWKERTR